MTIDEIKRQMFIDSEEVCGNIMIDTYSAQEYVEQAYSKAIDDFANTLTENYDYLPQILSQEAFGGYIDEYAEQLKAGGKNE